jgi:CRP/FNR family cyclic AMP-dependent transcriptional regulator
MATDAKGPPGSAAPPARGSAWVVKPGAAPPSIRPPPAPPPSQAPPPLESGHPARAGAPPLDPARAGAPPLDPARAGAPPLDPARAGAPPFGSQSTVVGPAPGVAAPPPSSAPTASSAPAGTVPDPRVVKVLQGAPILRSFTDTGLQILAAIAQEKRLPSGTPLFVENMQGDAMYVIASGTVRIALRGPDGREQKLVALGAGDSLGEASLLRVGPRLCSAVAETEVVVVEIARRDVMNLQRTRPQACLKLLMSVTEALGERLRDADPEWKRLLG